MTTNHKSSFSGTWSVNGWSDSHSNKDQERHVYLCAACWYVVASCTYAILGGSGIIQLYISYWTGSAWSAEEHVEVSGVNGSVTDRYGHNRDEGNLSSQPAWFHSAYPIWRIRYWPSRSNSRWSLTVYAGGYGVTNITPDPLAGLQIMSRGSVGATSLQYTYTTYYADPTPLFNPLLRMGDYFDPALDDSELVTYPYTISST